MRMRIGSAMALAVVTAMAMAGCGSSTQSVGPSAPVLYSGDYQLDNHFDLTGALPPSVANTITLLDEATDDHELHNENNVVGNSQYGLDPSAFLLDFVYRQFCRWQCQSGEDFDTCSQLNHAEGDISALYLQNFVTWSGAQSYTWGLCGGLDEPVGSTDYTYTWLNQQVQNEIPANDPTAVQNLTQLIGDITAIFTKMNIKSKLTLDVSSSSNVVNFTDVLQTLVLTVHDLSGAPQVKEVNLVDVGLTNLTDVGTATVQNDVLQIPKHSFALPFGKLLDYLYPKVLLPALGYASTYQMFASSVNCTDVGNELYQQLAATVPLITVSTYASFCDNGLKAAGDAVDNDLQNATSAKTAIEIQGSGEAGSPLGAKRLALTLVNGKWTGTITEGDFSAPISGTFTGTRQ